MVAGKYVTESGHRTHENAVRHSLLRILAHKNVKYKSTRLEHCECEMVSELITIRHRLLQMEDKIAILFSIGQWHIQCIHSLVTLKNKIHVCFIYVM